MNFTDNWNLNHTNWNIYDPNTNNIYEINTFDDGNGGYQEYSNTWLIYGDGYNGQKVALVNKDNMNIQIGSISRWKVDLIINSNECPS